MANSLVFSYVDAAKKKALDKALAFIDAIKDVSVIAYDDTNIRKELGDVSIFAHEIHIPEYVGELANDTGYLVADDVSSFVTKEELEAKNYLTEHQSLDGYAKSADINIVLSNLDASVQATIEATKADVSTDLAAVRQELDNGMINVEQYADDKVLALNNDLTAIINSNRTSAASDLEYAITRARGDFDASFIAFDAAKQDAFVVGGGLALENGVLSTTIDTTLFRIVDELPATDIEDNKIYLVSTHNSTTGNIYTEHIHTNDGWEKLGEFKATTDLSGYYTKDEVDNIVLTARQALEAADANNYNENNLAHVEINGAISALQTEDLKLAASIEEKTSTNASAIQTLQGTVSDHKVITDANTENITALDSSLSNLYNKEFSDYSTLSSLIGSANSSIISANQRIQENSEAIAAEEDSRKDAISALDASVNTKAEEIIASVNTKASQADLESLAAIVDTKASQTDLASLSSVVDTKASQASLDEVIGSVETKANQTTVDALAAVVDTKAASSDLTALTEVVGTKAAQASVDDINTALTSLSESITAKNSEIDTHFTATDASIAALETSVEKNSAAVAENLASIEAIRSQVSGMPKTRFVVVEELPAENDADPEVIYLKKESDKAEDLFTEYIYVEGNWEKLGTQKFDISSYATIEYVDGKATELAAADEGLAEQISGLNAAITDVDTKASNNKNAVDDMRSLVDTNSTNVASLQSDIAGVHSSISSFNETLAAHASDIAANNTATTQNTEAIAAVREQITSIDNTVNAHNERINQAEANVTTATNTANDAKTNVESLTTSLQTTNERIDSTESSIADLLQTSSQNTADIASLQSSVSSNSAAITSAADRISALEENDEAQDTSIGIALSKADDLEASLAVTDSSVGEALSTLEGHTQAITADEESIAANASEISILKAQVESLNANYSNLLARFNALVEEKENEQIAEIEASQEQIVVEQGTSVSASDTTKNFAIAGTEENPVDVAEAVSVTGNSVALSNVTSSANEKNMTLVAQ